MINGRRGWPAGPFSFSEVNGIFVSSPGNLSAPEYGTNAHAMVFDHPGPCARIDAIRESTGHVGSKTVAGKLQCRAISRYPLGTMRATAPCAVATVLKWQARR